MMMLQNELSFYVWVTQNETQQFNPLCVSDTLYGFHIKSVYSETEY
jgi:hypothetical protein